MHLQPKEARDVQRRILDGVPLEVMAAGLAASWIRACPTPSVRIHLLLARDAWLEIRRLAEQLPGHEPGNVFYPSVEMERATAEARKRLGMEPK